MRRAVWHVASGRAGKDLALALPLHVLACVLTASRRGLLTALAPGATASLGVPRPARRTAAGGLPGWDCRGGLRPDRVSLGARRRCQRHVTFRRAASYVGRILIFLVDARDAGPAARGVDQDVD
jgi:hypothetical protein